MVIYMSEWFNKKEAQEIEKKIERLGWEVEINNLDAIKHDNSIWWYEYDMNAPILSVKNNDKKIAYLLIADGDILITDPKNEENHFYFKGGNPDTGKADELTEDLVKNGVYGNNNWFEVIREVYNPKTKRYEVDADLDQVDDPVEYYIKNAVKKFIKFLKNET